MSRVTPLERGQAAEFEPLFAMTEKATGYVPNSLLVMARWPELLRAFSGLVGTVMATGLLPPELKALVAFAASASHGCRYCQAHTGHSAAHLGVSTEKLRAMPEFETSPLFDDAERAALRLARDAARAPSALADGHFEALRTHYDEREIVELLAQVALFGFLNRWNDSLATTLEAPPLAFAQEALAPLGWQPGPHAG